MATNLTPSSTNFVKAIWPTQDIQTSMERVSSIYYQYEQQPAQYSQQLFEQIGRLYASYDKSVPQEFYGDLCFQRVNKFREGIFFSYPESQERLKPLADAYQRCFTRSIIATNAQSAQAYDSLKELLKAHLEFNRQYGIELCAHNLDEGRGLKLTDQEVEQGISACFSALSCCNYNIFQQNAECIKKRDEKAQERLLSFCITYFICSDEAAPDFLMPEEIRKFNDIYIKLSCHDRMICGKVLAGDQIECSPEAQKIIEEVKNLSAKIRKEDKTGRIIALLEALYPILDKSMDNVSVAYQVFDKYKEAFPTNFGGYRLPGMHFFEQVLTLAMFSEQPLEWVEMLNKPSHRLNETFEEFRKDLRKLSFVNVIQLIVQGIRRQKGHYEKSKFDCYALHNRFLAFSKYSSGDDLMRSLFASDSLFCKQISQLESLMFYADKSSNYTVPCICCYRDEEPQKASLKNTWNSFLNFFQT